MSTDISKTHDPCCSSHKVTMDCETYRRTHFVENAAVNCCGAWAQSHPRYFVSDEYGSDQNGPLLALVAEWKHNGTQTRTVAYKDHLDEMHPVLWPTLLAEYGLAGGEGGDKTPNDGAREWRVGEPQPEGVTAVVDAQGLTWIYEDDGDGMGHNAWNCRKVIQSAGTSLRHWGSIGPIGYDWTDLLDEYGPVREATAEERDNLTVRTAAAVSPAGER